MGGLRVPCSLEDGHWVMPEYCAAVPCSIPASKKVYERQRPSVPLGRNHPKQILIKIFVGFDELTWKKARGIIIDRETAFIIFTIISRNERQGKEYEDCIGQ